eukprot:3918648-Prymnesium_polylepis.2
MSGRTARRYIGRGLNRAIKFAHRKTKIHATHDLENRSTRRSSKSTAPHRAERCSRAPRDRLYVCGGECAPARAAHTAHTHTHTHTHTAVRMSALSIFPILHVARPRQLRDAATSVSPSFA